MCFYNSMSKRALALAKKYGKKTDVVEIYKEIIEEKRRNGELVEDATENASCITAFPRKNHRGEAIYKDCSIITADDQIQVMQWGLIPDWIYLKSDSPTDVEKALKDVDAWRRRTFNARSEDIFEKQTFREPILRRRCIIPSTGYYEYHHNADGSTTPYFLYYEDAEDGILSMGGIWNLWVHPVTGEKVSTFSIITTPANRIAGEVHNGGSNPGRMPLILEEEEIGSWLDRKLARGGVLELMKTFRVEGMRVEKVGAILK